MTRAPAELDPYPGRRANRYTVPPMDRLRSLPELETAFECEADQSEALIRDLRAMQDACLPLMALLRQQNREADLLTVAEEHGRLVALELELHEKLGIARSAIERAKAEQSGATPR